MGYNNIIKNNIPDTNFVGKTFSFRPYEADLEELAKACVKPVFFLFYSETRSQLPTLNIYMPL